MENKNYAEKPTGGAYEPDLMDFIDEALNTKLDFDQIVSVKYSILKM